MDEERLKEIISQIQEVLTTHMMYGGNEYDDITIKEFRDLLNTKTQDVLDLMGKGFGPTDSISQVLGDKYDV